MCQSLPPCSSFHLLALVIFFVKEHYYGSYFSEHIPISVSLEMQCDLFFVSSSFIMFPSFFTNCCPSLVLIGIIIIITFNFISDIYFWLAGIILTTFLAIFHVIFSQNDPPISHLISSSNFSCLSLVLHPKSNCELPYDCT